MTKIKSNLHYLTLLILVGAFVLTLVNFAYAQAQPENYPNAPEPSTLMLILTAIAGWVVRFARKRFTEFKKLFDMFAASIGMVAAAPVMGMAAIFIKTVSPGPVFFKQERVGRDGKLFNIYKLRTMKVDAEKETGPIWASENDPRLIKCGKLIRKLHLDELPQLFNVLKGDMSIIGPRPERPVFVKKLGKEIKEYRRRLRVKPGITGLAQVRHKYDETIEDVKKKVKYDLLYIRKMCFLADIRILFQTVIASVSGKGAR